MKKISKSLFGWADAFVIIAIALFVASFVGFILNSAWSDSAFTDAIVCTVLVPFTKGFAVLVQNAEEAIAKRSYVTFEKSDEEK